MTETEWLASTDPQAMLRRLTTPAGYANDWLVDIGQAATDVHWAEGAEDTLDLLLTQLPLGLPAP